MISSGFWIVYGTLVVLIAGLAALTLYVAQSAIRKSFKFQEETMKRLLQDQERHLRKELMDQLTDPLDKVAAQLEEGFKSIELRLAEVNGKLDRAMAKPGDKSQA